MGQLQAWAENVTRRSSDRIWPTWMHGWRASEIFPNWENGRNYRD